ncbi:type II secretion system protein [Undibacterium sp. Dicai25W]|uniref:type II secretion system protein n=1 Tax=Undibacterium sp. Dicai25W TaxID=3413034 RepID=UPI003BF1BD07
MKKSGFTLIELLVVLAILALLTTLTLPRYFQSIDRSKRVVLVENLRTTREGIDKFFADTGRYPESLSELVDRRYLKSIPYDPVTESTTTWQLVAPESNQQGHIYDLHSGAPGKGQNGILYGSL